MCSGLERIARIPPAMRGWIVFTRPSSISGNCVTSATSRTGMSASLKARDVPPVERISIEREARPRANSTIPVLSVTLSRARCIGGMKNYFGNCASRNGSPSLPLNALPPFQTSCFK